jgi:hypothetical protein
LTESNNGSAIVVAPENTRRPLPLPRKSTERKGKKKNAKQKRCCSFPTRKFGFKPFAPVSFHKKNKEDVIFYGNQWGMSSFVKHGSCERPNFPSDKAEWNNAMTTQMPTFSFTHHKQ